MMGVMMQTAFLVIAILAVQKVLGNKLHAYMRYSMWLLVALRLFIPVNFIYSPFSMLRFAGAMPQSDTVVRGANLQEGSRGIYIGGQADAYQGIEVDESDTLHNGQTVQKKDGDLGTDENNAVKIKQNAGMGNNETGNTRTDFFGQEANISQAGRAGWQTGTSNVSEIVNTAYLYGTIRRILYVIWLTGSLIVGGFLTVFHIRFCRKLRQMRTAYRGNRPVIAECSHVPIYRVANLEAPCLVGFIRPAVYIDTDIETDSDYFRYAVTHEEVHYLHRDYIWALVRAVLVTAYWFHPFVWIAVVYSAKDGEIACDYGTIRQLGKEERFAYGEMLLAFSKIKKGRRIYSYGTMLHPHKSELKERIMRLTQTRGSKVWASALAAFVMIVMTGCAFTGAIEENDDKTILDEEGEASTDTAVDEKSEVSDSEDGETSGEGLSEADEPQSGYLERIEAKSAEISAETPFGVDGPHLDYAGGMGADEETRIIFHDYFGLIVYDLDSRKIVQSLDLASIGCDMTQGDNFCQVAVSADGQTVWLHPMSERYMYRYEVEENQLYREQLVKTFELDLEAEDLFDRYLNISMEAKEGYWSWHSNYLYEEYKDEQGLHNAYIYLWASNNNDIANINDDRLMLHNLHCVWSDMVFVLFADPFPYRYDGGVEDITIIYDEPCVYTRISDAFGERVHPITGETISHEGIDYAAAEGTDITAAADGTVYETGYSARHGNYVVLLHTNGEMTYYFHCQGIIAKEGEQVKRSEKIATVGNSGMSTGSHLHFALSKNGEFVNPADHIRTE